ncbi:MAG TPA: DUF4082 domain-containing protein [Candidatus Saccharimonadales bacterium]|nr:DUF4082 domain-containing protein [Candidatus Saccharimonadales bacterium]
MLAFAVIGVIASLWASAATTTESLWSGSTVPSVLTWSDKSNIELGVKFTTDVAGYINGVRFYKSAQNTGVHTGTLWDANGTSLGQVTFTNETKSGWQTAMFATPTSVASGTTYIVSYHAPKGHYSLGPDYFKKGAHVSGHLTAPQYSASNPNGVYVDSTNPHAFPTQNGDGDNYYVDVVFSAKLINPQPAPAAPTGVTATNVSGGVSVAWQASASTNSISNYNVYRGGSKLATVAGATLNYTDTTVAAGQTYNYQVQAIDSTGASSALSTSATVVVPSSGDTGGGTGAGGTGGTTTPPVVTGSTTCPLPAYPSPSCTGRPASLGGTYNASGAVVTTGFAKTFNGDYEATTPGEVIDNWHIVGHILVEADNITVKNSLIEGSITNEIGGKGFLGSLVVQDTSIVNSPQGINTGNGEICDSEPGIGQTNWTAARVYIDHHVTGTQTSHTGNITLRDSFVKVCGLSPEYTGANSPVHSPDGSHSDPFQGYCPEAPSITCDNITLDHTTFDDLVRPIVSHKNGQSYLDTTQYVTGPIFTNLGPGNGYGENTVVTNNLLLGGAYSMYTGWRAGPAMIITGNRVVDHSWVYGYGDQSGSCSNIKWSDNTSVTVDSAYNVTGTVQAYPCQN